MKRLSLAMVTLLACAGLKNKKIPTLRSGFQ